MPKTMLTIAVPRGFEEVSAKGREVCEEVAVD